MKDKFEHKNGKLTHNNIIFNIYNVLILHLTSWFGKITPNYA